MHWISYILLTVGLIWLVGDPLLRELTSTVISCSAYQPATSESPAGNRKKKGSRSAASDRDTLFEVILHDTVLFPEGGGQPSDIGTIRTSNGEEYEVAEVKRRGGHAIHFVKSKNGSAVGLEVGLEVTTALGEAGFMRRLDHVSFGYSQMHNILVTDFSKREVDVHAHLPAPALRFARNAARPTHSFLGAHHLPVTFLRGTSSFLVTR